MIFDQDVNRAQAFDDFKNVVETGREIRIRLDGLMFLDKRGSNRQVTTYPLILYGQTLGYARLKTCNRVLSTRPCFQESTGDSFNDIYFNLVLEIGS